MRFAVIALVGAWVAGAQTPVTIQMDAQSKSTPLRPIWTFFGYDEPNYTYAQNGRKLIGELAASSASPVYFRAHNLLTTGDGTAALKWGSTNAYTEDAQGQPVYNWTIVDKIFDAYISRQAKPFVEVGFTPQALSPHPEPYQHSFPKGDIYTGWTYPPNDHKKWAALIEKWVQHEVDRYGKAEVLTWYWEFWNEPDIGYWHGTAEEYDTFYDETAAAIKRVLPEAHVGGPGITGAASPKQAAFLNQFLEHCAASGAPLDFITYHVKGSPKMVDGHVQMSISTELLQVQAGFALIHKFPRFADLPIIFTEADPEGCAACSARNHPQNAYRNGPLYATYTALAIDSIFKLADRMHANVEGMLTWAFEFEGQPYFEGFRTLSTNGVDKPVLNLFRMMGLMNGGRIPVESSSSLGIDDILKDGVRGRPDIDALAVRDDRQLSALVWNYHDDDSAGEDAPVKLTFSNLPSAASRLLVHHYRIDSDHSNAFTVWKALGSPQSPTGEQQMKLEAAGQLQLLTSPEWLPGEKGQVQLSFTLPRQAVSLIQVNW